MVICLLFLLPASYLFITRFLGQLGMFRKESCAISSFAKTMLSSTWLDHLIKPRAVPRCCRDCKWQGSVYHCSICYSSNIQQPWLLQRLCIGCTWTSGNEERSLWKLGVVELCAGKGGAGWLEGWVIGEWLPGKCKNICSSEICSLFGVVYNILTQMNVQNPVHSPTWQFSTGRWEYVNYWSWVQCQFVQYRTDMFEASTFSN